MDEINIYILLNVYSFVKMIILYVFDWLCMLSCILKYVIIKVKLFYRLELLILWKVNISILVILSISLKMIV